MGLPSRLNFAISIIYWNDIFDPVRLRNLQFCWKQLLKFVNFANKEGVSIQPFLFDFSKISTLSEAVHVQEYSTKRGYLRSEKINWTINYLKKKQPSYFSIIDADVFITEAHYSILIKYLKELQPDQVYIFRIKNLLNPEKSICFETEKVLYDKIVAKGIKYLNGEPALGGLFFVSFGVLVKLGGFDTRFTVWGGEDDEIGHRLLLGGIRRVEVPIIAYHLPHLKEPFDQQQYAKQVKIVLEGKLPNLIQSKKTALFVLQPSERFIVSIFPYMDGLRNAGFNIVVCSSENLSRFVRENGHEFYVISNITNFQTGDARVYINIFLKGLKRSQFIKQRYREFLKRVESLQRISTYAQPNMVFLDITFLSYNIFFTGNSRILDLQILSNRHTDINSIINYKESFFKQINNIIRFGFHSVKTFMESMLYWLVTFGKDDIYFINRYKNKRRVTSIS